MWKLQRNLVQVFFFTHRLQIAYFIFRCCGCANIAGVWEVIRVHFPGFHFILLQYSSPLCPQQEL